MDIFRERIKSRNPISKYFCEIYRYSSTIPVWILKQFSCLDNHDACSFIHVIHILFLVCFLYAFYQEMPKNKPYEFDTLKPVEANKLLFRKCGQWQGRILHILVVMSRE